MKNFLLLVFTSSGLTNIFCNTNLPSIREIYPIRIASSFDDVLNYNLKAAQNGKEIIFNSFGLLRWSIVTREPFSLQRSSIVTREPFSLQRSSIVTREPFSLQRSSIVTREPFSLQRSSIVTREPFSLQRSSVVTVNLGSGFASVCFTNPTSGFKIIFGNTFNSNKFILVK